MYTAVLGLIFFTSIYPLGQAWQANRRTSLFQAVNWTIASWLIWGVVMASGLLGQAQLSFQALYLALCVTGCAGVAVLGARRPGVGAWNFVVLGLLAVQVLPLAEGTLAGSGLQLGGFRVVFLVAILVVGILNYFPTYLMAGAAFLGLACMLEVPALVEAGSTLHYPAAPDRFAWLLVAGTPWAAYGMLFVRMRARSEFDRLWLDFRDRFGFVWAHRVREQFNRSAANAGWSVVLRWEGLRLVLGKPLPKLEVMYASVATLRALLKRFGDETKTAHA